MRAPQPTRALAAAEIETLLALDIPAHLSTLDRDGFPRVTPIWFIWSEGGFYMTSVPGKRHLRDLARDHRASVCVDTEADVAIDGERANRQVRARGFAELLTDLDGEWTRRITLKYIPGPDGEIRATLRASMPRVLIRLRPISLVAFGTP